LKVLGGFGEQDFAYHCSLYDVAGETSRHEYSKDTKGGVFPIGGASSVGTISKIPVP
jgi:hypothetical protein